jgi:glycosyltransferase involved in cell wall biosynthesis
VKPPPRRLGIYNDGPFALIDVGDQPRIAPDPADFPFLTFACAVGSNFASTVVLGRSERAPVTDALLLPPGLALVELPSYDRLLRLGQVVRATPGTLRAFWRALSLVDVVWAFGPHPFVFLLVVLAFLRRRRVVLGVRQDTVAYFRARLPNSRWRPAMLAVHVWHLGFRMLARKLRATVVGNEIARAYGGERDTLLVMTVSLVRDEDVVVNPPDRDWNDAIELLTVGRIEQEKNPLLLVEALAALERKCPGRYRLTWIGTGPLEDAVTRRARELGISDQIELRGFVPFGPALLESYRRAHVFVHVSLTEGVPAVLIEALASATPIVATAVGGVAAALDRGNAGVLVPPSDLDALVSALLSIVDDAERRERLVRRGIELAHKCTLDSQAARVARFIQGVEDPCA